MPSPPISDLIGSMTAAAWRYTLARSRHRADSPSVKAARKVLVEGIPLSNAGRMYDVERQNVRKAALSIWAIWQEVRTD